MNTYNKSEIMSRAWRILRNFPNLSWSACLTRSWAIAKDNQQKDISPIVMNKILNGLRVFNRSRTLTENKPMMAGTREHFKMLNCKTGRRIMKATETESKQMLESGELFAHDIMHQRRKESAHFDKPVKLTKARRNRIVNKETCVTINIEEYINGKD